MVSTILEPLHSSMLPRFQRPNLLVEMTMIDLGVMWLTLLPILFRLGHASLQVLFNEYLPSWRWLVDNTH
jgi:hypothetical protein